MLRTPRFSKISMFRLCMGALLLVGTSACGPKFYNDKPITAVEELIIEKEADTEIENEIAQDQLSGEAMNRDEYNAYLAKVRAKKIEEKRRKLLDLKIEVTSNPPAEGTAEPTPSSSPSPSASPSPAPLPVPSPSASPIPTASPSPSAPPESQDSPDSTPTAEEEESQERADQIVYRPQSTTGYSLAETAESLGQMSIAKYLNLQKSVTYSDTPACNLFVITAFAEAKYSDRVFNLNAENLGKKALTEMNGWKKTTLAELRVLIKTGQTVDAIYQRDAPKGKKHGHIGVVIGLDVKEKFVLAEANLNEYSNRILQRSERNLNGFNIFIRTPETLALAELTSD